MSNPISSPSRIALIVLVLLSAMLRTNGLFENTFHPDEALFATWAREIAIWRDPLLQTQLVDKPPLLFYLQALLQPATGPETWAARLPGFLASLAIIPLTASLAWRLYRDEATMLLAAAFITFSPMAIQFSASGFIDPLMSCLVVAALAVVARHQIPSQERIDGWRKSASRWTPTAAGVVAGLAVLSKHQAWLFMPLVAGVATIIGWRRPEWRRWLLGFLPLVGLQAGWELLRGDEMSLIAAQLQSYGGLRIAWSWELWPRLQEWVSQWSYILRSPVLEMILLLAVPLIVALLIDQHDRLAALDRLLVLFVVTYSFLLWFIAVPVWDRYILALLPLIGLLLARILWRTLSYAWLLLSASVHPPSWARNLVVIVPLLLIVLQAPAFVSAYRGELPIGASPAADKGAAEISLTLANEPYGTVLYDHWYSWHWRYYLFDSKVYVSWFAGPDALVEDLRVFGSDGSRRFIALPSSELSRPVHRVLNESGYVLMPVASSSDDEHGSGIDLFRIEAER